MLIEVSEKILFSIFGFRDLETINDFYEMSFTEEEGFYLLVEEADWGFIIYNTDREFIMDTHFHEMSSSTVQYLRRKLSCE